VGSTVAFDPHRPFGGTHVIAYGDDQLVADPYLVLRMIISGDPRQRLVPRPGDARRLGQARTAREQQQAES
jgi:hypothetical protein